MGTAAVAEAAALLAASTGVKNLIIEKNKYRGEDGKNSTLSVVRLIYVTANLKHRLLL
jgi:cobalt-precorrin 5A hydrolase